MTTDKLMQMLSHHDAVMLLFFGKSMTLENLRLITEPYKLDIKITAKRKSNIIVLDNNDCNLFYVLGNEFVTSLYICR